MHRHDLLKTRHGRIRTSVWMRYDSASTKCCEPCVSITVISHVLINAPRPNLLGSSYNCSTILGLMSRLTQGNLPRRPTSFRRPCPETLFLQRSWATCILSPQTSSRHTVWRYSNQRVHVTRSLCSSLSSSSCLCCVDALARQQRDDKLSHRLQCIINYDAYQKALNQYEFNKTWRLVCGVDVAVPVWLCWCMPFDLT